MKPKTRGNGTGTAYKRGNTWTAQVVIGWKNGSPIKRTKGGFKCKKDAINYCPELLIGKPKQAPRLSEYWKQYSENAMQKIGKDKQCAYRVAWNKLSAIHNIRIDAITIDMLQETVNSVAKTFYTQKDCKTVLKKLFERAVAEGYINAIIPEYIELVPLEEKEQTPFNKTEQTALWKLYEKGNLDAAIPLLMIYTGMMPGEAQLLKVEHIDLEKRIMFGMNLKTKVRKQTPVVIADCLLPVIEDLIAHAQPSGYIWARNQTKWYERYYEVLEQAGCRKLPPYSCRHTTATALAIDAKIAPQIAKRVMRWSTAKMMDRYTHPDQTDALKAVNKLKKR